MHYTKVGAEIVKSLILGTYVSIAGNSYKYYFRN